MKIYSVFALIVTYIVIHAGCATLDGASVTAVKGPSGFHAACFDINGKPYINAIATEWHGDVNGVFVVTMDGGLKATIHGDRCLVEEMTAEQWLAVHTPAKPAQTPTPMSKSTEPSPEKP